MLIGIDASRANKPVKTGVEWYSWHLIQELKKLTVKDGHTWILYTNDPLKNELAELPENWYEVRAKWPPKRLWTQVRMSWEMWRRPIDVLFVPAHVLPPIRPDRNVVTVHDVGFRRLPKLYSKADIAYHEATTKSIAKCDARIITVSEFSGREIVELYKVKSERIAITYPGVDHDMYRPIADGAAIEAKLKEMHVPRPYFLYIGRLDAKKNVLNLVKAFDVFKTHRGVGDPTQLVLAGIPGNGFDEIKKAINGSAFKHQILQLGYVEEENVPYLLNGAEALVHVSWYEGFGFTPVQAMACGCPVVSSDVASLPEVIGAGNAVFVPPSQTDVISRALERIVSEPGLKEDLRQKGIARAARYTWRATAEATLPVLTQWIG
jgi:glycosyltransferase involved in cell wall biosynthesis